MILEAWHPVTHDFGLIESPMDRAVEMFTAWQESIGNRLVARTAPSLEMALQALPPLSAEKRRCAFIPTKSSWTGFFQSGIDGSDPFPTMSELSARLKTRGMRVCVESLDARYPATIWEVYAPESLRGAPSLGYLRSICAARDGDRWTFEQSGKPFSFEDTSRYALSKKRERFTRELLAEYLGHLHLQPFSDDFYAPTVQTPAMVLERLNRWNSKAQEFTLAQVVRGEPWTRRA